MKRVVIVILIIIVVATVGVYTYNEFRVREIVYVGDYESQPAKNAHAVKRLYSSDVDFDAYNAKLENLISLEFTEEEILKAALESGEPEFYPAFHTSVVRENLEEENFYLRSIVIQELAESQERTNFRTTNLRLEVITNNVTIEEVNAESQNILGDTEKVVPLINEAGTGMTLDLQNYGDTGILFNGTEGNIVLQYVFDIETVSIAPQAVLTDCFIRINVTVGTGEDGKIAVKYSVYPASTVEEYISEDEAAAEGEETPVETETAA